MRLRICVRDVELGKPLVAGAFVLAFRITEGVAFLVREELVGTGGPLEVRRLPDGYRGAVGFGVVLESPEGSFNLLIGGFAGVFAIGLAFAEASDIGGDGGVRVSDAITGVDSIFASGGVEMNGEEAVEFGDEGEFGAVISVAIRESCLFRSLPCMISASTLRSDSSSRSL